jgi:hypothetical protein
MTFLRQPAVPNLPLAPREYESGYQEQFNNVLRLYFNQLNKNLLSLFGSDGGQYLQLPYGNFYDTTDQSAASTTTAYAITLNSSSLSNGVSVQNSSQITVAQSGVYNVQFSVQLSNDDTAPQDIDIWFRVNGTDVDQSNTRFGLSQRKGAGDPYHTVGTVNLLLDLATNDYVQLMWRSSNTSARIEAYSAGTSPTRPAIPSVIVTVTFVSGVST